MRNRFFCCFLAVILFITSAVACAQTEYREYIVNTNAESAKAEIRIAGDSYSDICMEGAYSLDGSLYTTAQGWVEYTVDIPETALYCISIRYIPGEGTGADIQRALYINGDLPFEEAGAFSFSRIWNNINDDYKKVKGNQPFPSQVETPEWRQVYLTDSNGYIQTPLCFQLEKGENTLRFASIRECMTVSDIILTPVKTYPTYEEYLNKAQEEGLTIYSGKYLKLQAEDAAAKSGPSFYPLNDRTSPKTEPYHYSNIVMNMIGGSAWNEPGEWLSWDIEVPEDGLYYIGFRFKQSDLRGLYATRRLTVNGEQPFREAGDLRFYYDSDWQFGPLGEYKTNGKIRTPYLIRLNKGVNRISLEVSLGALGEILTDLNDVTNELNGIYREIVAITGSSPDTYRDYKLFTRIPDLPDRLIACR